MLAELFSDSVHFSHDNGPLYLMINKNCQLADKRDMKQLFMIIYMNINCFVIFEEIDKGMMAVTYGIQTVMQNNYLHWN